ncbi:MAG TPA: YHS domain-containing (seleno)protein [Vicinamibacterales bacterium]|nr:YHS domain-containing (seleno)protein [Vicinamibacterales bacterium]
MRTPTSPRTFVLPVFVVLLSIVAAATAVLAGKDRPVNTGRDGLAVKGYDVVAYMTEGKPVEGNPAFEIEWNGARWQFANAAHRDLFVRSPEKYAPQFGGYCAWAVSRNYTADADPQAWSVVDGRLYLNYSKRVQSQWLEDVPGHIARARANWPAVLEK